MKIVPERYLSEKQMSKALGVTTRVLLTIRKRGEIPFIKVGKKVYYDPLAVIKSLSVL